MLWSMKDIEMVLAAAAKGVYFHVMAPTFPAVKTVTPDGLVM